MDLGIAGRRALVCGGSKGLGRAAALALAREGVEVVLVARSPDSLKKTADEIAAKTASKVVFAAADITTSEGQKAALVACPDPDILITNPGVRQTPADFRTLPREEWVRWLDMHFFSALELIRAIVPGMVERRWGHIVNLSPPLDLAMVPGRIAYAISKLGMTLLTFGLAEEVRPHNVAVNSLWPVTIIESQASINHQLGTPALWRKPDILVDSLLRLVRKEPTAVTGQALLDEDFLRAEGVTDFSGYACVPGTNPGRIAWHSAT